MILHTSTIRRRINIIVRGIPEKENETEPMCEDLMRSFMKNKLGLDDVFIGSAKFGQCHILETKPNRGERLVLPIMTHFEKFSAKTTITRSWQTVDV